MPIEENPTIKLIFKGLIIAAIKNGNPFAEIGAFVESPCHKAELSVKKKTLAGEATIQIINASRISLEVENTSRTEIETHLGNEEFNRKQDKGDRQDFRWFIDLEADLHPGKEYTPKEGGIKPVFRVNNACFYTETLSDILFTSQGQQEQLFGRVALDIAANVYLDQDNSKAVLKIDGIEILAVTASDVEQNISYTIVFDCHCEPTVPPVSDFDAFYTAILPETPPNEQVLFSVEMPPAQPGDQPTNAQTGCVGGRLNQDHL